LDREDLEGDNGGLVLKIEGRVSTPMKNIWEKMVKVGMLNIGKKILRMMVQMMRPEEDLEEDDDEDSDEEDDDEGDLIKNRKKLRKLKRYMYKKY
jgi:hypothetical protein